MCQMLSLDNALLRGFLSTLLLLAAQSTCRTASMRSSRDVAVVHAGCDYGGTGSTVQWEVQAGMSELFMLAAVMEWQGILCSGKSSSSRACKGTLLLHFMICHSRKSHRDIMPGGCFFSCCLCSCSTCGGRLQCLCGA